MAVYLVAYERHSRESGDSELLEVLRGLGAERILWSVFVVSSSSDSQSLHDGYFYFERVPPGEYQLRIDPDQAAKLGIRLLSQAHLKAGADGGLVSGVDVKIGRGSATAQESKPAAGKAEAGTGQAQPN